MKPNIKLYFVILCICFSCNKDDGNVDYEDDDSNSGYDLAITIKTNTLEYYPESINLNFSVIVDGGVPPYQITWIKPGFGNQKDSIDVHLDNDLPIDLEVIDAVGKTGYLKQVILKDTVDVLVHDYRNKYIGFYSGRYESYENKGSGSSPNFVTTVRYDTFQITKGPDLSEIRLSEYGDIDFVYNSSQDAFEPDDGRINGETRFVNDSLDHEIYSFDGGFYQFEGANIYR